MKKRMGLSGPLTESQFYMWRTLFAVTHADDVVTGEEIRFMMEALEDIPFTAEQQEILKDDISTPQDIEEMFKQISNPKDQALFFNFARDLVWIDGDYGSEEQDIMLKLKRLHIQDVNIDTLIGNTSLELENDDDNYGFQGFDAKNSPAKAKRGIIYSFREKFLKEKMKD